MVPAMENSTGDLIHLAHEIGRPERKLAILGEGNVSLRISEKEFLVKASGSCLATLAQTDLTRCKTETVLKVLDRKSVTDGESELALLESRVVPGERKPSVETVFHAWLLTLKTINFVGHCHPTFCNQALCSPRARDFAERRLFPDEVVCCGPTSVFIPYCDPGVPLAREIRDRTNHFIQQTGQIPKLIVLQNHGIIAIGSTAESVLACILMAEKAAEIFVGAAALGGPIFMQAKDVERISSRPDEAYRQQQLKLG